jgi:hypothetical protein
MRRPAESCLNSRNQLRRNLFMLSVSERSNALNHGLKQEKSAVCFYERMSRRPFRRLGV